jgi:hypothetical protein
MIRILAALMLAFFAFPAQAHTHHHYRHHARHHRIAPEAPAAAYGSGIVTVATAAGQSITVAGSLANRFQGLIADFVAHGYRPEHIGCFARGGHVRGSRHYAGAACDFDQTGWGRTVRFMYHAHSIIVAHGFRDGCEFRDCGHVDDGQSLGRNYARHDYQHFAARETMDSDHGGMYRDGRSGAFAW